MCGIVGILGTGPVAGSIVDALKRLEYRGYDSAGVRLGLDRRYLAVRDAGEVELLLRIDAEGSPIWRSPCAPWTNQQAGKHARPQDACRGGVVREDGARSVEGVLSTGSAKSGCARGGSGDREKAGSNDLACSDGWDRVRLRAACLHRHEATQSSAQSRRSTRVWQGGTRSGLLD